MSSKKKQQSTASDLGQTAGTTVSQGSVYRGTVTGWDPDNQTYAVNVRGIDVRAAHAAGICSRLLGIQTRFRIPLGTAVEVVTTGDRYLIINTHSNNDWFPDNEKDVVDGLETGTGARSGDFPAQSDVWARDLLSGELDMTNALHAGIQLLTTFARLQGGDLAMVETHVLDDLVRIVSGTFQHFSAFGDQTVFERDGKLNSTEHGTSYEEEAWGVDPDSGSTEKFTSESNKPTPESVARTGRWRYSRFLGYLGDFVHIMVSDPVSGLGSFSSDSIRAGKARVQIQSDGTLLAQSVADIVLERVCRVQIPVQVTSDGQYPPELEQQLEQAETRFSRLWDGLREAATLQDLASMSYQLREYGRWLGSYQSLSRFATDGRWTVPAEAQVPTPSWKNGEPDRELANDGVLTHVDVYACIRIMRDGSIVVHSGDGSSLVMAGGSMQLHAARTLELAAGGDVVVRAGRDLLLDARRNARVMSVVGSLTLKSRTFWHALCEFGTMRMDPISDSSEPPPPKDGDPEPIVEEQAFSVNARGGVRIQGDGRVIIQSDGNDQLGESPEDGGVDIYTPQGGVRVQARGRVTVRARDLLTWLSGDWILRCRNMLMDVKSLFRIRNRLSLENSTLQVRQVQAQILDAQAVLKGPESPQSAKNVGLWGMTTKTGQSLEDVQDYHRDPDVDPVWALNDTQASPNPPQSAPGDRFPEFAEPLDGHRETITDQFIRKQAWSGLWPAEWVPDTWTPSDARYRVGGQSTDPYPGAWARHLQYDGGQSLNAPDSTEHKDLTTGPAAYTAQNTIWNYFNPQEET
jgi:hypothetical protein